MDRYRISDPAATHLSVAILLGLGLDPNKFTCSRSSFSNYRTRERKNIAEGLKDKFIIKVGATLVAICSIRINFEFLKSTKGSVVHWDGKQMMNITTNVMNERLPVKITHLGKEQLLGVPEIEDGKGETIANAVFMCNVSAMTPQARTRAAVFLELFLGRSLLSIPCRHHIPEIILGAVFELKVSE